MQNMQEGKGDFKRENVQNITEKVEPTVEIKLDDFVATKLQVAQLVGESKSCRSNLDNFNNVLSDVKNSYKEQKSQIQELKFEMLRIDRHVTNQNNDIRTIAQDYNNSWIIPTVVACSTSVLMALILRPISNK
jgi:predicted  nucleic acid-binding Zn-ribbon protein